MTAIGALIGLSLSILLIIRKLSPTYSLIIGAIVGGLLGGLSLNETVTVMTEGVKEVTPAVLRILTAGVLSGILIQTGATTVISNAIINKMGEKRVFMALALATMLLCTVGVFIDVAVITVAPVALSIGKRLNLSPSVLLIAMVVALIIYLIKTGQTKILKQIAIKFVTDAEGECGAGTGIIKLSEVVAKMYAYLPSVVRILFTEKQLVQIAESVLAEAKKKWEANENLTTYIENKQQTTPAVVTLVENTK